MKKSFLQLVVCPLCQGELVCESFSETGDGEMESGVLVCECGASYPLIGGIPRLLPPTLQNMLWEMHPNFFESYRTRLPSALLPDEKKRARESGMDHATKA